MTKTRWNIWKHHETSWNILQSCRSRCKLGGQINNPVGKGITQLHTAWICAQTSLYQKIILSFFQPKTVQWRTFNKNLSLTIESDTPSELQHHNWQGTLLENPPKKWTTLPGKYLRDFMFSVFMFKNYRCIQLSNPRTVNMTAINRGADEVDFLFVVLKQESHILPVERSKWWAWEYLKIQGRSRCIAQIPKLYQKLPHIRCILGWL